MYIYHYCAEVYHLTHMEKTAGTYVLPNQVNNPNFVSILGGEIALQKQVEPNQVIVTSLSLLNPNGDYSTGNGTGGER